MTGKNFKLFFLFLVQGVLLCQERVYVEQIILCNLGFKAFVGKVKLLLDTQKVMGLILKINGQSKKLITKRKLKSKKGKSTFKKPRNLKN